MSAPDPVSPDPVSRSDAPHVKLSGLTKAYGRTQAVDDFSLEVPRGSFTTLLGPSGCGKTTVLRMIAGFVQPTAGTVSIGGVNQTGRPPNLRGVGMVFQDYALFPHMSVLANVEYGLRMHRVPRAERRERATAMLELLGLSALAERYPHQLSGGQQQRVALGRVMALEPEVLLMDEPLSNLDAKLRLRLRAELKALQRQLGITTLYVTHDQDEALSLSDQLVVMHEGRAQQIGTPQAVYRSPTNRSVAEFVGNANVLPAVVLESASGSVTVATAGRRLTVRTTGGAPSVGAEGWIMVRPENVRMSRATGLQAAHEWTIGARVRSKEFSGASERYWLELADGAGTWLVDVPSVPDDRRTTQEPEVQDEVELGLAAGVAVWLA